MPKGLQGFQKGHKKFDVTFTNEEKRRRSERMKMNNPTKKLKVRNKIANTIKRMWQEGLYGDRINGMTGKYKWLNVNYKGHKWDYREFLAQFQDITKCYYCDKKNSKIDIHHIDENHDNWLITNLVPICVHCHRKSHIKYFVTPFETIGKTFSFCSAHHLIEYTGKCQFNHGHQYFITIFIRQRINFLTGMVLDFGSIKSSYREYIHKVVDHKDLNDVTIEKTTAENLLIWLWQQLEEVALVKGLQKIELKETDSSFAMLEQKDMLEWYKSNQK